MLDEKMAHLESEWQRKISALANTHSIFEQLAAITGKKGKKMRTRVARSRRFDKVSTCLRAVDVKK